MSAGNPVDTSYQDAVAVTPSDTVTFNPPLRALYVGTGAGTLAVITPAGNTVSFGNVPNGSTIPLNVSTVKATGTTVSNIVGLK